MNDFLGFNPETTESAESFEGRKKAIPEGDYKMVATECKRVTNKNGNGFHWWFSYAVIAGEHAGYTIEHRYNINNSNAIAERIGRSQLKRFLEVIGILNPTSEADMLNIAFMAHVKCEKRDWTNKDGEKVVSIQNVIAKIDPLNSATSATTGGATATANAANATTGGTSPSTPTATAATPDDDTPPWEKQNTVEYDENGEPVPF